MKLYMRQDLNGYQNKSIIPCIEYILTAIIIDNILKYYHMPLEYDFYFETIDDVWKYFEFINATIEGIDMREFIDIKDVSIFKIIKVCIRHNLDYSEIINSYNIDGADFAKAQFKESLDSEKIKNDEFSDFIYEFGSASKILEVANLIHFFASENRNPTFLWCRSNTMLINHLEVILRYQYKILNDMISKNIINGSTTIQKYFNETIYSFKIVHDEIICGLYGSYELSTSIRKPVINLEDKQK